jgi:hypothetical protein
MLDRYNITSEADKREGLIARFRRMPEHARLEEVPRFPRAGG